MKIINLMEDTEGKCGLVSEHGLCIYVETKNNKILIDTGASEKTWYNAKKLGINLNDIDMIILSHGHYDHSGGIMSFIEINPNVKIYLQKSATYDYYNLKDGKEKYIGIDKRIKNLPESILLDSDFVINKEISIFSNVKERRKWPKSNLILKQKIDDEYIQDEFSHEQYVVIKSEGKTVFVSGCAHNGILNILDKFRSLYMIEPDIVISGIHMMKKEQYVEEEIQLIKDTAYELSKMNTIFYTGHCTGIPAFNIMKQIMRDKLKFMLSGDILTNK